MLTVPQITASSRFIATANTLLFPGVGVKTNIIDNLGAAQMAVEEVKVLAPKNIRKQADLVFLYLTETNVAAARCAKMMRKLDGDQVVSLLNSEKTEKISKAANGKKSIVSKTASYLETRNVAIQELEKFESLVKSEIGKASAK